MLAKMVDERRQNNSFADPTQTGRSVLKLIIVNPLTTLAFKQRFAKYVLLFDLLNIYILGAKFSDVYNSVTVIIL